MCEFCDGKEKVIDEGPNYRWMIIEINKKKYISYKDKSVIGSQCISIDYCPYCGKELVLNGCDRKDLENKIKELESELAVKENLLKIKAGITSKEDDLLFDPISAAECLINLTYERETSPIEKSFCGLGDTTVSQKYEVDELEQIAEHLLIYCKHNKAVGV